MNSITPATPGIRGTLLNNHRQNQHQVAKSLERLSTGKRINRPSDDPSGFIAAENLRGDILVLGAKSKAADSNKFQVRQRQFALAEIQRTLTSVRGNLTSAAGPLNTEAQSNAIQQEINASLDAIDRIASRVEGVGGSEGLKELREGGKANVIDGDLEFATQLVDGKLNQLSSARAAAASYQRTEDIFEQLRAEQIIINTEALSQIEDADFAQETSNLVQGQILSEASISALAFANRESVEQMQELLEGIDQDDSIEL